MRFKYFTPIITLYMAISLADLVSVYRMAEIGGVVIAGGIFILPLMYFLEDLIAEIYGYSRARQAIWSMLGSCLIFATLITLVSKLPTPAFWKDKASYDIVFSHMFRVILGGGCVGLLSGSFINSIIISKLKVLVKGKHFILRSIGSSAIGQAIQNLLNCFILYLGVIPFHNVISMVLPLYFIQMTLSLVFAIGGTLIVRCLKKIEGVDIYDYSINYNPFVFAVDGKNSNQ